MKRWMLALVAFAFMLAGPVYGKSKLCKGSKVHEFIVVMDKMNEVDAHNYFSILSKLGSGSDRVGAQNVLRGKGFKCPKARDCVSSVIVLKPTPESPIMSAMAFCKTPLKRAGFGQ